GIRKQLLAQVIDKIVLPSFAKVFAQTGEAFTLFAVGEGGTGLHWLAAQVFAAPLADGAVVLENQADRIEGAIAAGAGRVLAMASEELWQRQLAKIRFILRQLGNSWRWWWNLFTQHPAHNPVAALDRACAQPRCVLGEEDGHRQQAAATVRMGIFDV